MKRIVENDPEKGECGDYCGPGIFFSLAIIVLVIASIAYCVINIIRMTS